MFENHTLKLAEEEKFQKHEESYSSVGLAFIPFVLGCFGSIGSQPVSFRYVLAFLELRQHDNIHVCAELALLSSADSSQVRALCFLQNSVRSSAALEKATVIWLSGAPSLPVQSYLQHRYCAWNRPGPADVLPQRGFLAHPSLPFHLPFLPSLSALFKLYSLLIWA